ncbi:MAG: hypothetical protein QW128_01210 [Thermoprotei archaeon]
MGTGDDPKVSINTRLVKPLRRRMYSLAFILVILLSILIPYIVPISSSWILFAYWSLLVIIAIMLSYLYLRGEVR